MSDVIWLIDINTPDTQCLHVCIKDKNDTSNIHDVICSDYECFSGHRQSKYMKSIYNNDNATIELIEDSTLNILSTLTFMHSDSSYLDYNECSALTYARTAYYLQIDALQYIINKQALSIINSYINTNTSSITTDINDIRNHITIWDAIAIVTLFGDTTKILPLLNYDILHQNYSNVFLDVTLFSSCRNIFNDIKYNNIICDIYKMHDIHMIEIINKYKLIIADHNIKYNKLLNDCINMLKRYINKFIIQILPCNDDNNAENIPGKQHVSYNSMINANNVNTNSSQNKLFNSNKNFNGLPKIDRKVGKVISVSLSDDGLAKVKVIWRHNGLQSFLSISDLMDYDIVPEL
jgi:hypothetical protein